MIDAFNVFVEASKDYGLEHTLQRFYGVYRAFVVDTNDLEERGRVKVRCPGLTPLRELSHWASPIAAFGGFDYGIFFQPAVGEAVYLMFENGNFQHPMYIGGWWACPQGVSELPSDIANPSNPYTTKVIKTPIGHGIVFEDGDPEDTDVAKRVEIFTGKREEANSPSLKLHRILLTDKEGEERIEFETEKFHTFSMDDAQQFITLKSTNGFELLLNDAMTFAHLMTPGGHILKMDDGPAKSISLTSTGMNSYTISDINNSHLMTTAAGRSFAMDDTGTTISISDAAGNLVSITPTGIAITSASQLTMFASAAATVFAAGGLTLTANGITSQSLGGVPAVSLNTGPTTSTLLGGLISTVIGVVAVTVAGIVGLTIAGALTVTAASIIVTAGTLTLVGGTNRMMNNAALALLATHTHPPLTGAASTDLAIFTASPDLFLTQSTST